MFRNTILVHLCAVSLCVTSWRPYAAMLLAGGYNMTAASGGNPFLRDSKFTNPISESEKAHAEASDFGSDDVTPMGSSLAPGAGSAAALCCAVLCCCLCCAEIAGLHSSWCPVLCPGDACIGC